MSIATNAPFVSDAPSIVDTTITNQILFAMLQALDQNAANALSDTAVTTIIGNELE